MNFASDNVTGACPEVLQALVAANEGSAMPYGNDPLTASVEQKLIALFGCDLKAFPVATGTACNALALACLTPSYGAIYCHAEAHINVDECGAPELMTGGAKLVPLQGEAGKLTPEIVEAAIHGAGEVHHVQPAVLSLTNETEAGTLYRPEEIAALAAVARRHGLKVHLDGARFANAVAALGCSPAELTWRAGVDVLSFGATKNGCLCAEAVVFFDKAAAAAFPYHRKRAGHLFSKMRMISAQLAGYFEGEVWLRNARHANRLAGRLAEGLAALPGCRLLHPAEANEVFVEVPALAIERLRTAGFQFYEWAPGRLRLVCAWNTSEADVAAFLDTTADALSGAAAG
ncbi:L-threonine aldolase [Tistlia consotensis]|uniref:L-threonine aldolase n=1 Tax=Tistlia consotensis USBA 355 TaxID=560819 RepID=A0A1Y6CKV1_9PROT|nr:low specificity L-threonine aldolase [Tistlia consotensis]SMF60222.1 L-threonine aldolase [Tistlia consotensis USBA 355]SNR93691.1 L-threonine aldolase [Tistlia consotensis]